MNNLKIKVCGMRDPVNIRKVAGLKPDMMGFVFYPASPRYAGEAPVDAMFDDFPPGILKTGVFVDEDFYTVKSRIIRFQLQAVQLHGNESPGMCRNLKEEGIKVIKAFRISENPGFSDMLNYVSCTDWFLFDTSSAVAGGSGLQFNWEVLKKYKLGHPFILSGGIGPDDAEKILALKNIALAGVDVNSKFESEPGIKNIEKLKRFMQTIRKI